MLARYGMAQVLGVGNMLHKLMMMVRWFKNGINNGNFANGTTGWTANYGTLSAVNGVLTLMGNGSQPYVDASRMGSMAIASHKYYLRASTKVTNNNCVNIQLKSWGLSNYTIVQTISLPVNGTTYKLSGVLMSEKANQTLLITPTYSTAANASGSVVEIQNVLCADLTALFGAGNEPTLAWCDANIAPFVIY